MREVEHEVQLAGLEIGERGLRRHARAFAEEHAIIIVCDGAVFPEVFVYVWAVHIFGHTRCGGELRKGAGKARRLGNEGDDVLSEAVHAHVKPEAHDGLDLLADGGVVVVEIRLLFGEDVQVIFARILVGLPGAAFKEAVPVVGRLLHAGAALLAAAPKVIVPVWAVYVPALLEPLVLVRSVVHDKVHENAQAARVRLVQQFLEQLKVAVFGVYVLVVRHVVTKVCVGRGVERGKPYRVRPQALDIVELREDAPEVAYPIAVAVAEAARPDLVDDHGLIPSVVAHSISLQAEYNRESQA